MKPCWLRITIRNWKPSWCFCEPLFRSDDRTRLTNRCLDHAKGVEVFWYTLPSLFKVLKYTWRIAP